MTLSTSDVLVVIGILLTAGGMIATAVWCVATIKGTTGKLSGVIDGLAKAVSKLQHHMEVTDERLDNHGQRIARIEGRDEAA